MSNKLPREVIYIIIAIKVVLIGLGIAAWLYFQPTLEDLEAWRIAAVDMLNSIPVSLYFLAFVILPAFGAPLTLFYLTALPVMGVQHPAIGLFLAWLALALNMIITLLLTRSIFHPAIEWVIRHRDLSIPKISPDNEWKIVLAVRTSPLPFSVQNYMLALGHSRWRYYLGVSLPIQAGIGTAVMFLGESILTGGISYVFLAIFVIIVINLLLQGLRKKLTGGKVEAVN